LPVQRLPLNAAGSEESREIAMGRVLRLLLWGLIGIVALGSALGALFGYFVYSPAPDVPRLYGTLTKGTIVVSGLKRTYLTYVPRGWRKEHRLWW
jgi:polyhydroxybutyrate depolymerase